MTGTDLGLAVRAYNVKSLSCPLEAEKIPTEFKVFFIDTGLLLSQLGDELPAKILDGDLGAGVGFETFPLYALGFMKDERKKKNVVQMVDATKIKAPN